MVLFDLTIPLFLVIPHLIAIIALTIGSYTDLRTREVPDWNNYGLIGIGLGINLLFSTIFLKLNFIVSSVIGLVVFFVISWIMFYTGQWGGGDSKILMGLGALIGIDLLASKLPFLINFLINMLLIGAFYGIVWSIFLILKNRRKFAKSFSRINRNKKVVLAKRIVLILFFVLIMLSLLNETLIRLVFLYLALISVLTMYLWAAIKAVESSCMLKYINPKKLTEGDWIAKVVRVNGKYIAGPKDLGIGKNQIKKLVDLHRKKKVKKILIKEGIPFVPSFLIAYIVTLMFGNLAFLLF